MKSSKARAPMTIKEASQHDERLGNLETEVKHVSRSVTSLAESVSDLVREIKAELKDIREGNRITWPLIFTAIGTIVMVASVAGTLHYQSLKPIFLSLEATRSTHDLERQHIKEILDLRSQIYNGSISKNETELSDLKEWSFDHERHASEINTKQQVQIDQLIKQLDHHIEMKSHFGSMEELVEIRSKLAEMSGNRFTSERGAMLEATVKENSRRLEIIDQEQRNRTNKVYSEE